MPRLSSATGFEASSVAVFDSLERVIDKASHNRSSTATLQSITQTVLVVLVADSSGCTGCLCLHSSIAYETLLQAMSAGSCNAATELVRFFKMPHFCIFL